MGGANTLYTLEHHFLVYGVLAFALSRLKGKACETMDTPTTAHSLIGAYNYYIHWEPIFVLVPINGKQCCAGSMGAYI